MSRLSLTRICKFDSCQKMFKLEYKLNIIEDLKNNENQSQNNIENFILSDIKNSESKLLEFIIRISKKLK